MFELRAELIAAIVQELSKVGIQHIALLRRDVDTEQLRSYYRQVLSSDLSSAA